MSVRIVDYVALRFVALSGWPHAEYKHPIPESALQR